MLNSDPTKSWYVALLWLYILFHEGNEGIFSSLGKQKHKAGMVGGVSFLERDRVRLESIK